MLRLPEFIVIGAARSGTTALYSYLRQAPDVFMPAVKEPNFFAYEGKSLSCQGPGADFINNSVTDIKAYKALFDQAEAGMICGEASPLYLFEPRAPERIRHHVPDAKMIAILRNPIDQAFSHFLYAARLRIEPIEDFTEALAAADDRLARGWQPLFGYADFPRYGEQLERYFTRFPRDQFLIRTYEELCGNPEQVMSDSLAFIGADPAFVPDLSNKPNAGGTPKNRAFQDFLMKSNPITKAIGYVVPTESRRKIRDRLASFNLRQDQSMPKEARTILKTRLSGDIRKLETLIDRDLSAWLA